jgi:hypothetical protein
MQTRISEVECAIIEIRAELYDENRIRSSQYPGDSVDQESMDLAEELKNFEAELVQLKAADDNDDDAWNEFIMSRHARNKYPASRNLFQPKSDGHLFFAGDFEYYLAGDEVFRAPISNVIECGASDIAGCRSGRFECYRNNMDALLHVAADFTEGQ